MKGESDLEVIVIFALISLLSWWLGAQLQSLDNEVVACTTAHGRLDAAGGGLAIVVGLTL